MARSERAELAELAREFLEQRRQMGDSELWPKPAPDDVARFRTLHTSSVHSQGDTPHPRDDTRDTAPKPIPGHTAQAQPVRSERETPPMTTPIHEQFRPAADTPEPISPDAWEGLTLAQFEAAISDCTRCRLHEQATNLVFGKGNPDADIMFIGEAPGQEEDRQGIPFVGRAGKLLDDMIAAMQLDPADVYIGNICKHRPPNNRDPRPDEMAACMPYLLHQIELIKPRLLCLLGRVSAHAILNTTESLGSLRERWFDFHGAKVLVTYHPAALLRNPSWKRFAWEDLKRLREAYDGVKL